MPDEWLITKDQLGAALAAIDDPDGAGRIPYPHRVAMLALAEIDKLADGGDYRCAVCGAPASSHKVTAAVRDLPGDDEARPANRAGVRLQTAADGIAISGEVDALADVARIIGRLDDDAAERTIIHVAGMLGADVQF